MKTHEWDNAKNIILKNERGVSFEDILYYIESGKVLAIVEHPNQERYPGQNMYVIDKNNYAYLVPYVESGDKIFLKTIIPSRKATKKYLEH